MFILLQNINLFILNTRYHKPFNFNTFLFKKKIDLKKKKYIV